LFEFIERIFKTHSDARQEFRSSQASDRPKNSFGNHLSETGYEDALAHTFVNQCAHPVGAHALLLIEEQPSLLELFDVL
jgi:hypothetical protein